MRLMCIIFIGLALSACIAPRVYVKPGGDEDTLQSDYYACKAQAMSATTYQQNPFIASIQTNEIVGACLYGKGWREQAK